MSQVITNFMKQQGFLEEPPEACNAHFTGLNFQPKVILPLVLVAILLGSAWLFLTLSVVLWWNTAMPRYNLFELFYNRFVAEPKGKPRLTPAPAPRRFAQGMAATFMLGAGTSLLAGWQILTWTLEAFVLVALAALLFGKFCLASYIFHLLRGRVSFANGTLPWAKG